MVTLLTEYKHAAQVRQFGFAFRSGGKERELPLSPVRRQARPGDGGLGEPGQGVVAGRPKRGRGGCVAAGSIQQPSSKGLITRIPS